MNAERAALPDDAIHHVEPHRLPRHQIGELAAYDLNPGDTIHVDTGNYALAGNIVLTAQDSGVTITGPASATALLNRGTSSGYVFELQNADAKVNALAYKALALWYLGFPDQAQQTSYAAVDWAKQIRIPHMIAYAYLL
jgi:hypothetical protein